jgi:hypothetical protein
VPSLSNARYAWYANRQLIYWIRQQNVNAVASSTLTIDMIDGMQVMSYSGIPLRRCDALRADENTTAPISA